MKLEDSNKLTAETYTAKNIDGQTWLVADNPYPKYILNEDTNEMELNYLYLDFNGKHPDIILTDHLPDGTKVRGDEIEINEYICYEKNGILEQVATLNKMRFEAVGIDDELLSICDWLLEKYNDDFMSEKGKFYHISRLSIAGIIIEYHKSREKSREK